MIDKRRFTRQSDCAATIREIAVLTSLQTLQSKHLPRLVHVSEDKKQYYVVMDYIQGGSLSTRLQMQQSLCEVRVQGIGRSLLLAVAELHRLSLGHFNLSPDNILLNAGRDNEVVLCDFGYALNLCFSTGLASNTSSACWNAGSSPRYRVLHYVAPELLWKEANYGLAADLWSVGVILYEMFCGHLPFEGASRRVLKDKILLGKFEFAGNEWHSVSRSAKQLISSLLHPDPQVRLTVGEALEHPWIASRRLVDEIQVPLPPKKTKLRNKLKRIFGRTRELDSHQLQRPLKVSFSPRIPTSLKHSDLSTASTLTDSQSNGTGSSEVRARKTLPRPLGYYRRPRLVGL
jgi:serine/threonine protein kinase